MKPLRLLTISSSYIVALNRRLPQELARLSSRWQVTAAAPKFTYADLRTITLEPHPDAIYDLRPVSTYLSRRRHITLYGRELKTLCREGWDFVHAWEEPFILSGGQIARAVPRATPLVFASFQNLPKRYPPPFNWIERFALNRARGWIAFGQTIHENLRDRPGYQGKPSRTIPIGVDTEAFRPDAAMRTEVARRLEWPADGPPVVGMVGRFIPEKGFALLQNVLENLGVPWRALFVGGGPMEAELRDWARRFPERVRVITGVPHNDVPLYMNGIDVLAAPSQTTAKWREQLGRMILEAFASGVPVIGSDSGEIPHVIGSAGQVCGESDTAAWRTALGDLLANPHKRRALGAAGRQRALDVYAWPVVARQHLDFFEQLLAP